MKRTTPILPLATDADVERFWESVVRTGDECWLWVGLMRNEGPSRGYGRFYVGGKVVSAHRFAWTIREQRDVLPGHELDHLCRNRRCVNPDHVEEVTHRENVLRSNNPAARNARKTVCKWGHPLSGDNLYVRPDGKGRACKECNRIRQSKLQAQRRAAS